MATRQLYIVIVMYCVSDYDKKHATALDTNRRCACTYSCDFSQVCSPTPNCNRENVALGKPANISSLFQDSGPACVGVNGNTGTIYISSTSGQTPNCIHTAERDNNAWWQVNLGRAYTVTNISVFIRGGYPDRMDGVSITVDGQGCYVFPTGTTGSPVQKQISCNTPRTGSLVKFSRNGLLNICEVQVWVCKDGFFGKDCTESCGSKCRHDLICDNYYGTCLPDGACSCSSGCNFIQSCIPTDNCRKENVALGKQTRMSSTFSDIQGPAGPACVAVNGNTGTIYVPDTQSGHPNCIHNALDDQNAWWEVDLGRNYTITDITVYIRENVPERMDNVNIIVDSKDCYTFPTGTTSSPPVKNISCIAPLQGRIVRFSRNVGILNFCEVQVWVCKPGLYGEDCEFTCNCRNNEICDNYYGSCLTGCSPGYYGFNCTQKCGRCKDNSACNSTNGNCMSGCQTGWEEPMCKKCSEGYYGINCSLRCGNCKVGSTCNSTNGQCFTGCETGWKVPMCTECSEGYYGYNCSQRCGNCKSISSCNASTGQCLTGCNEGWLEPMCAACKPGLYGEDCDFKCNCRNNETCDNYNGSCLTGCSPGYYSFNCTQKCGRCKDNSACNSTNGNCMSGCQTGWEEPMCTKCSEGYYDNNCSQKCGNCKVGSTCNSTTGQCLTGCETGWKVPMCTECSEGFYGYNCSEHCGNCKDVSSCNASNGQCLTGCQEGWLKPMCAECITGYYGEDCSIPCGHCKDGKMCNNTDGVCPEGCEDGFEFRLCNQTCSNRMYGPNCSIECGHCLAGGSCNATNGVCQDGCDAGYNTTLCNEKCSCGTWGRNCQYTCGACLGWTCRHDNGICENGCFSGYEGEHCTVLLQQTNDRHLTGVIAGSVVGAGLLIGVSIVTAVLIWLRRSTLKDKRCPQPSPEAKETLGTSKDNLAMENVNFHDDVYDKLDIQEDVAKPYEVLRKENHIDNDIQSQYQNTHIYQ